MLAIVLLAFTMLFSVVGVAWCMYLHSRHVRGFSRPQSAHWHRLLVLDLRSWNIWYLRCALAGGGIAGTMALMDMRCWQAVAASCVMLATWLYLRRRTAWAERQHSFRRLPAYPDEGTPVA